MARVSRLIGDDHGLELRLVEPLRQQAPQAPFPLGSMPMRLTVKGVADIAAAALAGDHEDQAQAPGAGRLEEGAQPYIGDLGRIAVKVEAGLDLGLAAQQTLSGPAIEAVVRRRRRSGRVR